MLTHYLTIALRNLAKHKVFSFINLLGLTIGFTCCLLMAVYIQHEFIAVVLACLGLFGLSIYTIQQRAKEIGIRKVLGASVPCIVMLLSKEFLVLVLGSMLIAFPVAWWAVSQWLQHFVYPADISWWIFVAAAGTSLFVSFVTVSLRTVSTAFRNPVHRLRSE